MTEKCSKICVILNLDSLESVMLKRRPCRLQIADCEDCADCADCGDRADCADCADYAD